MYFHLSKKKSFFLPKEVFSNILSYNDRLNTSMVESVKKMSRNQLTEAEKLQLDLDERMKDMSELDRLDLRLQQQQYERENKPQSSIYSSGEEKQIDTPPSSIMSYTSYQPASIDLSENIQSIFLLI